ncbi:MAG TPA: FAD-linked oxidase C-terminal domain-containing protein [Terriglobales bacterium]|nr:FAD-linked oxidase C-terminal domain-containing protein [Terriglobales bacterium]
MPGQTQAQEQSRTLESALRGSVRGEVRFDNGSRALYATDGSNYRQVPIGVVIPRDADDVIAAISTCREHGAPILCRGGGTSLAGQCCNVAVVLDFSKYMANILELDPERRIARVQPGVVLDHLRNAAEKYNLTFGPDPASHSRCTLGGMIGNNSCGVHSVMAGKTDQNVEELDVLTYDGLRMRVGQTSDVEFNNIIGAGGRRGEIYSGLKELRDRYGSLVREKFPNIPRRVSGYNLNYLLAENNFHVARALVGSEGTCVTVLGATVRLVQSPPKRVLLVIGCPDVYECADLVPEVLSHRPIGLEGMDDLLIKYTRKKGINSEGLALLPDGGGWLLAEFGAATLAEAEAQAQTAIRALGRNSDSRTFRLLSDPHLAKHVWEVRESALGAVSNVPGEPPSWEGWEDSAVAPEKLGPYLRELIKLTNKYEYRCLVYGHFGDGCTHNRMDFDLQSAEGIAKFRSFMEEAADLVVSFGGTISGEHGDGQARAELYPRMFGPELVEAFSRFKSLWDPDWKMNPGKVVRPNKLDEDLRLGLDYKPWQPQTNFKFPQDEGSLARATLRCVGVGKCRQYSGGVMCPSFRVTREEKHSTRGRAHLLWEMTNGDVIPANWRDDNVKSSLDLCLSCKGCKSDCPVAVDVATYKAEFLSHYYEGQPHPLAHYAFARIDRWARLASVAPSVANFFTQTAGIRGIAKTLAGVSPRRNIPPFAKQTFRSWFQKKRVKPSPVREVLLWPDTLNNYFHPETAIAAVSVLEAAGFTVRIPRQKVCCGRPLYDFGMLNTAKQYLLRIFSVLAQEIAAGIPMVVLEPSCASVFRDEMLNLFPEDGRARKLAAQVFLLGEFLEKHASQFSLPHLPRKALVHGHCHHKSIMKMSDEESILRRMGVDYQTPAAGCCGMAGAFGFEKEKYATSIAIGELELLPAVRNAPEDWLIIADGFSCREQIQQCTGRKTLHLAEVIEAGLSKPESKLLTAENAEIVSTTQRN